MNNLKRIFSLALATVMVLGMMVVGASATSFTDDADITHDAAVETMAALNIIGGMDDGSFQPNGKVTRAQMAKMITFALNGGKDPKVGTPITSSFTDTTTHWAAEYIEYCANLGIIGGRGDGTFDPEGKVKANEAAKMLLVAIGYDAETFGFGGPNWSANVLRMATTLLIGGELKDGKLVGASSLNLFDDLAGVAADAELTRDQAAQLIYNGIQANGVLMSLTGVTDGKPSYTYSLTGPSILVDKFGATVKTGVLTAVDYTDVTKTTAASWDYTVVDSEGEELPYTTTLDISDLFMQKVRVVAQGENVLSITAAADDVVSTGAFGGLKKTTVTNEDDSKTVTRLNGYKVDGDDASALDMYSLATLAELNDKGTPAAYTGNIYDEYRLIDNDGDGAIDCVVVIPVSLTTVKTVTSKAITLNVGGQVTFENHNVEDGLTKGAYVTVTTAKTGVKTVKAAETMTGLVDATRTTNGTTTLRIDGKWYTADKAFTGAAELNGSECDLVLVAGYIVAGKPVEETVKVSDAVMAVTVAKQLGSTGGNVDVAAANYLQIRILKNDNTTQVLNVIGVRNAAKDENGDNIDYTKITTVDQIKEGEAYTYAEDPKAEGFYNLTKYTGEGYTQSMTGANAITVNRGIASQTVGATTTTFRFDNDATVFVLAGTKYAALKGSDVNAWGSASYTTKTGTGDVDSALYATSSANGFTYVQMGFLNLNRNSVPGVGASTSTGYGIVTSNAIRVWDTNNKQYALSMTIWNGAEEIEVMCTEESENPSDTHDYLAGTIVTYTDNNNGTITGLNNITVSNLDAVTAFDGNDTIKFAEVSDGGEYKLTKDTVIVYVDLANGTGADGVIEIATPVDEDNAALGYYGNVWVGVDADDKTVTYLIVDVSGALVDDEDSIVK